MADLMDGMGRATMAASEIEQAAKATGGWHDAQRGALERSRLQPMADNTRRFASLLGQATSSLSALKNQLSK